MAKLRGLMVLTAVGAVATFTACRDNDTPGRDDRVIDAERWDRTEGHDLSGGPERATGGAGLSSDGERSPASEDLQRGPADEDQKDLSGGPQQPQPERRSRDTSPTTDQLRGK